MTEKEWIENLRHIEIEEYKIFDSIQIDTDVTFFERSKKRLENNWKGLKKRPDKKILEKEIKKLPDNLKIRKKDSKMCKQTMHLCVTVSRHLKIVQLDLALLERKDRGGNYYGNRKVESPEEVRKAIRRYIVDADKLRERCAGFREILKNFIEGKKRTRMSDGLREFLDGFDSEYERIEGTLEHLQKICQKSVAHLEKNFQ